MSDPAKGISLRSEQTGPPAGRNHLLVIAIDAYTHCPRLNNCVKDARDFTELLTSRYQFATENITTLYNEEATRPNILARLRELRRKVQAEDNLVVYFSGHGETEDEVGYWVPVEAQPEHDWEYVSTNDIKSRLDAINSFHTFVIVDACFSGALFATYKSVSPGYETKRSRLGLAASHSRERALDGKPGENSPFARCLLKKMRENTGRLGVQELATAVIEEVQAATRGRQTPVYKPLDVKGDDSGQYVFHLKADETADWAACLQADTPAGYRAFLAQYPESRHGEAAGKRLAELEEATAWAAAQKSNTVTSYNRYLDRYPAGPQADEAFQAIKQLEDDARWEQARRIDQVYAYRDYLRRFPDGKHQEPARQRIRELEQPAAVRSTPDPPIFILPKPAPPPIKLFKRVGLAALLLLGIWGATQLMKPATQEDRWPELFRTDDGKFGYRDPSGRVIITPLYEAADSFRQGRALVSLNGQRFTIDTTGTCVADCPEIMLPVDTFHLKGLTWTAKNLDIWVQDSWCFGDDENHCKRFGRLYTWEAAKRACTALGSVWRLPTDEEWRDLAISHGGLWDYTTNSSIGDPEKAYSALIEGGNSGFSALLGGQRNTKGESVNLSEYGLFWTSTAAGTNAIYYRFKIPKPLLSRHEVERGYGYSCRCVKGKMQKNVEQDQQAWQDAENKHTIAAYKTYQTNYPQGKYYADAGQKIRKLEDEAKTPSIRTIRLNGLNWTAENLNIAIADSWCYEDKTANCDKYGRLYTWAAAKKACAALGAGWRLPTDEEWRSMAKQFGGADNDASDGGVAACKALIEGGSSGFSALLGGYRDAGGSFRYLGDGGFYWSATEQSSSRAWSYYFLRSYGELDRDYYYKALGFSCRCVQD